jgi:hypothetical protein
MARKRLTKKQRKNKRLSLYGLVFSLCSLSGFGMYHLVLANTIPDEPVPVLVDPNVGLEAKVVDFFEANGAPEMIPIIQCESNFRHYHSNGSILTNKAGSSAIGIAQIMSSVHPDPRALKNYNRKFNTNLTEEDFDLQTVEGNLGYALMLYELRGTRDWECGKKFRFQ